MSELLTTESVSPADRLDYWREVICAVYVQLDVEPVVREDFGGSVSLTPWGGTRISQVGSRGQIVNRSGGAAREDCLISLQISGIGRVTQAGRTAILQPGDFALYDTTKPYELAFDDDFSQIVLQFPRAALVDRNVHIESTVARTCFGGQGIGAVTASFVRSLADHDTEIPDVQRDRLGEQVVDVAATSLSAVIGALPTAESVRVFNRQRILDFVDLHLSDPNLSVGSIATAFGVSARTVQKLFADEPAPLSIRIRDARMARARRALEDPLRRHQTITRIAHELGYGSSAHFSRVFRSANGCSPTEFREQGPGDAA
ncbi:MAG: helix-turn-helix domain-containing protein [Actinomycetota bacterium]